MQKYEVLIETLDACAGQENGIREFREVTAPSPEAYVRGSAAYPITEMHKNDHGDTVITTANGRGYVVRYTFTA